MAIRRRITTRVDEIDYSVDDHSPTRLPVISDDSSASDIQANTPTGFSNQDEDVPKDNFASDRNYGKPAIGRTFPDLVVEFKNDYRAMATALTLVSFIVFIPKIDSVPLYYPVILAAILNIVWFGIAAVLHNNKKN